jgi:predicted TIM-barrel fold metal-dependent hydrolase
MDSSNAAGEGIVDCHLHVIGPPERYPMLATRSYTPAPATLREWWDTVGPLGVTHGVVVQPSFYGVDNGAMLAALEEGSGRLVGIAAVQPDVTEAQLDVLAAAGVRGVRMAYFESGDPRAMGGFVSIDAIDDFESFASRLHARDMHPQLFTDSRLLPGIEARLADARIPIVIDHMGRAPAHLGAQHAGVQALVRLLCEGRIWVKLSGVANISDRHPTYDDARRVHEALLAANPEQLVWGSDWPHTKPAGTRPHAAALMALFHAWTPAQADRRRILTLNPRRLYRLASADPSLQLETTDESL